MGQFGLGLGATHLRLTIVAVDVLQVRDNALRVARVARVDPVHRSLRRPGKRVEVQPLVAHLPKANARSNPRGVHRASRWAGASHLRVVELGIGAVRLHRRRGAAGQVGRRLEAGLRTRSLG